MAADIRNRQTEELDRLMHDQKLSKYSVNGSEDAWKHELKNVSEPGVISIPRLIRNLVSLYKNYISFSLL